MKALCAEGTWYLCPATYYFGSVYVCAVAQWCSTDPSKKDEPEFESTAVCVPFCVEFPYSTPESSHRVKTHS